MRADHPQKLTECLDRGGLWRISIAAKNILTFRIINKDAVLLASLRNVDIQSNFALICEGSVCKVESHVSDVIIKDKCDNSILTFVCLCVICIGAFMRVSACFLSRNVFTQN